jgi:integrase
MATDLDLIKPKELTVNEKVEKILRFSKFNKSASTQKTHFYSLWDFSKFIAKTNNVKLSSDRNSEISKMMKSFCDLDALNAKLLLADYLISLGERNQSSSTVATKLAAVKDHIAFQKGITNIPAWDLDFIKAPKVENKKVPGPTENEFALLLKKFQELEKSSSYIDRRDALLCYLLSFCALRTSEALSINIEDIDWQKGRITVSRKGRKLKQDFNLGKKILNKIQKFVLEGKRYEGPLFINQDKVNKTFTGLTRGSAYRIVKKIGESVGMNNLHPHKFRHFSATEAIIAANGNRHEAMKFTSHLSEAQISKYEDERNNQQLNIATKIEEKWLKN